MFKVLAENDQLRSAFIILKELQGLSERNWTEIHRRKIISCEIKHYSWKLAARIYKESPEMFVYVIFLARLLYFLKKP